MSAVFSNVWVYQQIKRKTALVVERERVHPIPTGSRKHEDTDML